MRPWLLVLLFAACAAPRPLPALPPLPAEVKAVDVHGTTRFSADQLRRELGAPFERWLVTEDPEENTRLEEEMQRRFLALGFAWGKASAIGYFKPGGMQYYITLDVVEPADRARRMPFTAEPTGDLPDADGLCAAWGAYESKVHELLRKNAIPMGVPRCEAFHCLVGFEHPELEEFGKLFAAKVPAQRESLLRLLRESADARERGAAAYLVAHLPDGNEVVRVLLPRITDPSSLVRNNAMRVLQAIAVHHPELAIPLGPALDALDFPATTDRNKALAMVTGLASRPEHRAGIVARGAKLIELLRLTQPNNHDFAWEILKKVSGKNHGERDYAAWEAWLATQR